LNLLNKEYKSKSKKMQLIKESKQMNKNKIKKLLNKEYKSKSKKMQLIQEKKNHT